LRRIETTTRISHLAPNVVKRLGGDSTIELIAGDLISVEIEACNQRVVVKHLLEVRHKPSFVDRVAVKAPTELIVHAAARHLVQRQFHSGEDRSLPGSTVLTQ